MANFADVNFLVWEATASLKQYIEVILRKGLKQSYCEILESVPAGFAKLSRNFHPSLSGCSALAGNRHISLVCRYIIEIWPVLMACTWKNRLNLKKSVDQNDRLTFLKHLVEIKSQFPCGILFLRLAQKQVQIWGRRFSSIVGFRSPNFAQRNTLVYWNRKNRHFEVWEKKYWEMEFLPLGNESSPFCRTEWFYIHVKTAFFHLSTSIWLIGQGGWKLRSRPRFDCW